MCKAEIQAFIVLLNVVTETIEGGPHLWHASRKNHTHAHQSNCLNLMLHSLLLEFMVITTCEMVFTSGEHSDHT